MKKFLSNNKIALFLFLIIDLIYYFLITNQINHIFKTTELSKKYFLFFLICISFLILYFMLFFIFYFFIKNYKKNHKFIKHFLCYFSIMLFFLILLWPGIFKGDEYDTLLYLRNLDFWYPQHYLTCLFYLISLCIIPTMGGITLMQIFLISLIVGYIFSHIEDYLKSKKLIIIMYIIFLFPPMIDNNLFTLRSSLISYLLLLFSFELIFCFKDKKYKHLIKAGFISVICGVWRSELCFMPLALLIYVLIFYRKQIPLKKIIVLSFLFSVLYKCVNLPQKYNLLYSSTSVLNPLSILATYDDIKSTVSKKDVDNIEAVASFDKLAKYAYPVGANIYFTKDINKNVTKEQYSKFMFSTLKLFKANPLRFTKARLETFKWTNFAPDNRPNHTGWEQPESQWTLVHVISNKKINFHNLYPFTKSLLNDRQKQKVLSLILLRDNNYKPLKINHLFYNICPILLIAFIYSIYLFFVKNYKMIFILSIFFLQFVLIFLTAPTNFWMYYVSLYIVLHGICYFEFILKLDSIKYNFKFKKIDKIIK